MVEYYRKIFRISRFAGLSRFLTFEDFVFRPCIILQKDGFFSKPDMRLSYGEVN